jgi:hypothetical protein
MWRVRPDPLEPLKPDEAGAIFDPKRVPIWLRVLNSTLIKT